MDQPLDFASARTVELFAGPGGWDEGARLLGADLGITGFDLSKDAVTTARAAGHTRVHGDVLSLHPSQFTAATGLIASPPCPTFSGSGLRSGLRDYQQVLDVWTSIGWGIDAAEALAGLDVEDPRTALLATAGVWALSMPSLEWIAMEQVPAVEFAWEDLIAELFGAEWDWADVHTICASDFGVPSRRRRTFLVARRYSPARHHRIPLTPAPHVSMADALGWEPGHRVITRGNRRPTGGNAFSADGPSWCLTGSSRTWEREDGLRLTSAEAGMLCGFDPSYPWSGSRTSAFQQASDVVAPLVAAHILGEATDSAFAPATLAA